MNVEPKISKRVGQLLVGIVIGFALVALYANIQKLRRNAIEMVRFIPAASETSTPSPSVSPH